MLIAKHAKMAYRVQEVSSRRDLKRFVRFPDRLYEHCPQYVPALHSDQVNALTRVSTLSYCTRKMWLVLDGDQVAGRICAMVNPRYNERYGTRRARFGWFDTVNDFEVARLLLETAEAWAKEQGMDEIHGPLYYNTLGKQGMLTEGFDHIPPFNCLYNYPYYNDFVTRLGYEKECDWVQYLLRVDTSLPEKTFRVAEMVRERYRLRPGSIDALKKDPEKVHKFFQAYNESFASSVHNFIPFTEEEIGEEAKAMLPFVSDKVSNVLYDEDGEVAAFGIALPSISKGLQKARGHLFPSGWIHLLRAMHDYETIDLMINGATPKWQHKGISAVYIIDIVEKARKLGIKWAVTNPQIENNSAVNIWNAYEREPFMKRRCYCKQIK